MEIKDEGKYYDIEYTNIHNRRNELVRLQHLWYQIALTTSFILFTALLTVATTSITLDYSYLLIYVGTVLATILVWIARYLSLIFDRQVVELYPRIVALELILDYHFYRFYLSTSGEKMMKFIINCEKIETKSITPTELWKAVLNNSKELKPSDIPPNMRGHNMLDTLSFYSSITFVSVALSFIVCNVINIVDTTSYPHFVVLHLPALFIGVFPFIAKYYTYLLADKAANFRHKKCVESIEKYESRL